MEGIAVGARVLVCGDLFDTDNTHWQQCLGFGEYIDTDPPAKTVFFHARVTQVKDGEMMLYFEFDETCMLVLPEQIYQVLSENEPEASTF